MLSLTARHFDPAPNMSLKMYQDGALVASIGVLVALYHIFWVAVISLGIQSARDSSSGFLLPVITMTIRVMSIIRMRR